MAGCVSEDAQLSTFASPESVRELQRWNKTNYQLDTMKFGRKRGKKHDNKGWKEGVKDRQQAIREQNEESKGGEKGNN